MQCDTLKDEFVAHGGALSNAAKTHLEGCGACEAFVRENQALNALLREDPGSEPRPGFDTKFFARLEAEKTPAWRRALTGRGLWLWGSLATAAALVLVLTRAPAPETPPLDEAELALAMNLPLLENYEVLADLTQVEDYALLAEVQADELEALFSEAEAQ